MSDGARYLVNLHRRVHALADQDSEAVREVRRSLQTLMIAADIPQIESAIEQHVKVLDALAALEPRKPRVLPTDAEISAAVAKFGGVRAAARVLNLDASNVSRRVRKVLRATPELLPTSKSCGTVGALVGEEGGDGAVDLLAPAPPTSCENM